MEAGALLTAEKKNVQVLALPFVPENGVTSLQLGDFDEFWLDYTSYSDAPECLPNIKFEGSILPYFSDSKALQNMIASTSSSIYSVQLLSTIDTTQNGWKEKEYSYLMDRLLGLAPDEDWRYIQSNQKNGLIQRRLHEPLDKVEVLDIAVAPGTIIKRVNLMVSQKDNYRDGEVIEFADPINITLEDGRQGVRLNLREPMKNLFSKDLVENIKEPGKHNFYLQEIFIYIPGEARAISEKKPVQSLSFYGQSADKRMLKNKFRYQRYKLASRVVRVNRFRQRMVVDLRELVKKGKVNVARGELLLLPPLGAESCAISIEGMQTVRTYSQAIPAFADRVENWKRGWLGGLLNLTRATVRSGRGYGGYWILPLSYADPRCAAEQYSRGCNEAWGEQPASIPAGTSARSVATISNCGIGWEGDPSG